MSDADGKVLTFWEHLEELRARIIRAAIAFVIGAGLVWYAREPFLVWVVDPFVKAWPTNEVSGQVTLHFAEPAALFVAYVKLSLIGGLVLALPLILYQAWAFVAPGLYSREKRFAIPFVFSSCLLFAAGALFWFRIAAPMTYDYFLSDSGRVGDSNLQVIPTVMVDNYISFTLQMLLAFGLVFELPVVAFFLAVAGIVNYRQMIQFSRYFVVIAFVVGAVLTPPDPGSQLMLAIPLIVLYGVSIGVAYVFGRRPPRTVPVQEREIKPQHATRAPRRRRKSPRRSVG